MNRVTITVGGKMVKTTYLDCNKCMRTSKDDVWIIWYGYTVTSWGYSGLQGTPYRLKAPMGRYK